MQLPERMASHFDLSNRVDGWMSRTPFLALTVGLDVLMAGVFLALPALLGRIPDALINLPHEDDWLAPSRRAESPARMATGLLAVGVATMLLLLVLFQGVFALNAELARATAAGGAVAPRDLVLPLPFGALMGGYLLAVAVALAFMLLHFRKPA